MKRPMFESDQEKNFRAWVRFWVFHNHGTSEEFEPLVPIVAKNPIDEPPYLVIPPRPPVIDWENLMWSVRMGNGPGLAAENMKSPNVVSDQVQIPTKPYLMRGFKKGGECSGLTSEESQEKLRRAHKLGLTAFEFVVCAMLVSFFQEYSGIISSESRVNGHLFPAIYLLGETPMLRGLPDGSELLPFAVPYCEERISY